jgi:DNA-binding NarL/FixJ family response regulator
LTLVSSAPIRILSVDDHPLLQEGIAVMIRSHAHDDNGVDVELSDG